MWPTLQRWKCPIFQIKYDLDILVFGSLNSLFSYAVSLRKWLAHFFLKRINGEISRNEHFLSQENDGIFHIFCQINFSYQASSSLHGGSLLTTLPISFITCIFAQLFLAQCQKLSTLLVNTHSIRFKITHI